MKLPDFILEVDDVIDLHAEQIKRFGGSAGIRDESLLRSAVRMPLASFAGEFLHPDLFSMAVAYLFHLVQNHPFVDGNKRIGTAAALTFLDENRVVLRVREPELSDLVLRVATGVASKQDVTEFLRAHS